MVNENRKDAGTALEPVVYDILNSKFGHAVTIQQGRLRYNRDGSEYPTVYAQIDGIIGWHYVPHLLEIKTTTEKNYNYVLRCIDSGKTCDSLEAYRHQLRKYAAMVKYGICEGWEPPERLELRYGVLAIMNRNTSQVSVRRIRLFEREPALSILEAEMQALELKYGIRQAQEDVDAGIAKRQRNARRNKDRTFERIAYNAARGFVDGIAKRIGR